MFALSTLALALFLWWSTAGLLDRQTEAAIKADTQGLLERYDEGGLLAVEDTIEQRLISNIDDDAIYLLASPDYRRLAGNLERWPTRLRCHGRWNMLPVERAGQRSMAELRRFEMPGGYHLLVGRDVEVHEQMARLLTDALLWSAGVALLLGTVGTLAVRSLFRMTLADVSATSAAISAGRSDAACPRVRPRRRVRPAGRDHQRHA